MAVYCDANRETENGPQTGGRKICEVYALPGAWRKGPKQQAEEQILALGKALQRAGRSEEAIKAMTDEKYLKELLKEFGI